MQELKNWINARGGSVDVEAETLCVPVEHLHRVLAGVKPMTLRMVEHLLTADPSQSRERWVALALMSGHYGAPVIDFSNITERIPQERRDEAIELLQRFVTLAG